MARRRPDSGGAGLVLSFWRAGGDEHGETGSLIEPSPIPGVALTRPQPLTESESPDLSLEKTPTTSGAEPSTSLSQAPALAGNTSPVEIITAATPGQTAPPSVTAQAAPGASVTIAASSPAAVVPKTSEPLTSSSAGAPVNPSAIADSSLAASPSSVDSSQHVPPLVATSSSTPVTHPAKAQAAEYSRTGSTTPWTLLEAALVLAGVILAVWGARVLLRPASPRGLAAMQVRGRSAPIMEPRFQKTKTAETQFAQDEQRAVNTRLAGGPPQLSIQLKALEPSVRRATIPVGKLTPTALVTEPAAVVAESSDNLITATPAESFVEMPVEKPVEEPADVDVLSRTAAGEVSEVFPIEVAPREDFASIEAAEEIGEVAQTEAPGEPAMEPPVTPAWAGFDSDFSSVGEPVVMPAKSEPPAWDVEQSFASEEVIASVESALDDHAEAATPENIEALESELEPIGQGQPIPYQTSATTPDSPIEVEAEVTKSETQVPPELAAEGFFARAAALAGFGALRPAVDTPSFASQVVSTDPSTPQSTTPAIMPEPTTPPPAPGIRTAPAVATPAAVVPGAAQSAVQITFSFEIASMQLTSAFKMGTLLLKPISKVVAMRLAPSQQPQPAMNLQVTFEVSSIQLAGNAIGTIRLTPSGQQRPSVLNTPSFAIAGLQLVSGSESAPVQLTPSQQGQTSVHVTAGFQIATVEFSPSFEIASLVLNSTSKRVLVQLPGAGPTTIEGAPIFEMTNVQLTPGGDIGMVQLSPSGAAAPRVTR